MLLNSAFYLVIPYSLANIRRISERLAGPDRIDRGHLILPFGAKSNAYSNAC